MSMTLKDAKEELFYFVEEAEKCLQINCGYSAILILFSVILTVSEALLGTKPDGKPHSDKKLIEGFVDQMPETSWFLPNKSTSPTDAEIKDYLYEIRNSLSHQLSLPTEIGLITNAAEQQRFSGFNVRYFIAVEEFISCIKNTINLILVDAKFSSSTLDPSFGSFKSITQRELGSHQVLHYADGLTSSGSAVESRIPSDE